MIITPPPGAPLLGTIQRSHGMHDDLYARVLVLNDGRQRIAILGFDLIGMDLALADEICGAIRERTGVLTTLLNCSHTHSAPFTMPWSVLGWRWLSGPGREWRDGLVSKTAELVSRADATAEAALLRVGRARAQIGSNRRLPVGQAIVMKPNPGGVVVPWVDVLRVDRLDEGPAVILFSHAAHPVIIHGASRLVSADYPGFASRKLKDRLGGNVMTMFGQACGANINADPLRGGFLAAEQAGVFLPGRRHRDEYALVLNARGEVVPIRAEGQGVDEGTLLRDESGQQALDRLEHPDSATNRDGQTVSAGVKLQALGGP